jgi:hypothetical protein
VGPYFAGNRRGKRGSSADCGGEAVFRYDLEPHESIVLFGACMTPSMETWAPKMIFRMCPLFVLTPSELS